MIKDNNLYPQQYGYDKIRNFLTSIHALSVIQTMTQFKLNRFNFFDAPERILTTQGQGVYLFIKDRRIEYVGEAKEILTRINRHVREKRKLFPGDKIITIHIPDEKKSKQVETILFTLIQPKRNRVRGAYGYKPF